MAWERVAHGAGVERSSRGLLSRGMEVFVRRARFGVGGGVGDIEDAREAGCSVEVGAVQSGYEVCFPRHRLGPAPVASLAPERHRCGFQLRWDGMGWNLLVLSIAPARPHDAVGRSVVQRNWSYAPSTMQQRWLSRHITREPAATQCGCAASSILDLNSTLYGALGLPN